MIESQLIKQAIQDWEAERQDLVKYLAVQNDTIGKLKDIIKMQEARLKALEKHMSEQGELLTQFIDLSNKD